MSRSAFSLFIAAAAALFAAAAQPPRGSIQGVVLLNGGFIAGATVTIDGAVATTDRFGHFELYDVAIGKHRVCAAGTCIDAEVSSADPDRFVELKAASSRSADAAPCRRFTTLHDCPSPCNEGQFLVFRGNTEAKANEYYGKVDAHGKRLTLTDWLRLARYEELAPPVRASYANANDLGFGRDMYMTRSPWGVFAWVSNFAADCKLQDRRNAALAARRDPRDVIATVCMELSSQNYHGEGTDARVKLEPRIVKFLVFDHDGKRVTSALLDSFQPGFVPGLCLNCHGGRPFQVRPDLKSNFLPFDIATFQMPDGAPPDYPAFRKLNDMVKETLSPDAKAIRQLIEGWYPDDRVVPRLDWRPPGWDGTEKLYDRFVARMCRTCHVALSVNQFTSYVQLKSVRETTMHNVREGIMPHAQITYMNFHGRNDLWPDDTARQAYLCFEKHVEPERLRACLGEVP
ncbi:MAG TPA: carboxypeptidase-like regulatory domain-containing protein [Vicinamibacterales bacterium]